MKTLTPIQRAELSLEGLAVGDAFGEQFFGEPEVVAALIRNRNVPDAPWAVTDDTIMAAGIVEVLEQCGTIDQYVLAKTFARRYWKNPSRGYGAMAHYILQEISADVPWRTAASNAFGGLGSFGNGGAMRAAPLGAYFCGDFKLAAEQASLSAEVTHMHLEGKAGAVAVAIAAAYVCSCKIQSRLPVADELLTSVIEYTPQGDTSRGIRKALKLPFSTPVEKAVNVLGNESKITAPDTVPFCLWCAAGHLDNYEAALWTTVSGLGDRDTTCAIVGGIVVLACGMEGIPVQWFSARESRILW